MFIVALLQALLPNSNQPDLESESETQFNDEPEGDRVLRGPVRNAVACQFVVKLYW